MKATFLILVFLLAAPAAFGSGEQQPYLAESKVHTDLELALSRLISREQFLLLVNTEVQTRVERKMVEGETITTPSPEGEIEVEPMPGFLPDPDVRAPSRPTQMRQIYRSVETPFLAAVRVHVSFDQLLPGTTVQRAKMIVQDYLQQNHPSRSYLTFNLIPMLKAPSPEEKGKIREVADQKNPNQEQDPLTKWLPWIVAGGLFLALLLIIRRPGGSDAVRGAVERAVKPRRRERDSRSNYGSGRPALSAGGPLSPEQEEAALALRRKKLLDRFIGRSESFRMYYQRMAMEVQGELVSVLKGPALDGLLGGLGLSRPRGDEVIPSNVEECIARHEVDFEEFVQAKDWQDKQFFGFLHGLTDEQIVGLVNHESPLAVCLMLRFMKANQSAKVLESLPAGRRVEVLQELNRLNDKTFSEIADIEHEVRTSVKRMPSHLFGSQKEDLDFWGSVLMESEQQDEILADLETTQPGIGKKLSKYKFRLEDAASLHEGILEKVLGQADNDELGLALATVPKHIAEVLLESLPMRRRDYVESSLESFRSAPKEQLHEARISLSKRFREVMT